MELISNILIIVFFVLVINSGVKYPLDKLTMYKKSDITEQSSWFVVLFVFFGFIMLLFINPIRQYRKEYYIQNEIRMYEFWVLTHHTAPPTVTELPLSEEMNDKLWNDYVNNKRHLKLIVLNRKTKRNVLFRKIGF